MKTFAPLLLVSTAMAGWFDWSHAPEEQTSTVLIGEPEATEKAFFDVTIDGVDVGTITFGLFGDVVPITVKNFAELCSGEAGDDAHGVPLWYKGSPFHRLIPGFMAQGGDFTNGDGTGGESIYGPSFDDENFDIKFTKPYQLAMANAGPNTNGSQFFITFEATTWLDGHHVIFGEVLDGFDVVDQLENIGTQSGAPTKTAIVANSGRL